MTIMEPISGEVVDTTKATTVAKSSHAHEHAVISGNAHIHLGDQIEHHYHPRVYKPDNIDESAYEQLRDSLRYARMDVRLRSIGPPSTGTCKWLFDNSIFRTWFAQQPSSTDCFLWIKGIPGSGKSTILKAALAWARKHVEEDVVVASYFFNGRAAESLERSSLGFYRSLTCQLLVAIPSLRQRFWDRYSLEQRPAAAFEWTTIDLQNFLIEALRFAKMPSLYLFVDALNEAQDEEDTQFLLDFLHDLAEQATTSGHQLHVCLSTRHYPHLNTRGSPQLVVEDQPEQYRDIELYTQQNLRFSWEETDPIPARISHISRGCFLWAALTIPSLNRAWDRGSSDPAMLNHLLLAPSRLEDVFVDMLESAGGDHSELSILLLWVSFSTRVLNVTELYLAFHHSLQESEEAPTNIDVATQSRFLLHLSRGLLKIATSEPCTVKLIHGTVFECLKSRLKKSLEARLKKSFETRDTSLEARAHGIVREACYRGLAGVSEAILETKKLANDARADFPFIEYATTSLFRHAETAERMGGSQTAFLTDAIRSQTFQLWLRCWNVFEEDEARRYGMHTPPLYVLADQGFPFLVACFVRDGLGHVDEITEDGRYGFALQAASANGHEEVVDCLLSHGANVNLVGGKHGNALFAAISSKHIRIIRLLAEAGACADSELLVKPLVASINHGFIEGVKLLLEFGAPLNCDDESGVPLFILCIRKGDVAIVELLLEKGVDLVSWAAEDCPLQEASLKGDTNMIQLLLDRGFDVNALRGSSISALHVATSNGHLESMRLLIAYGADVNAYGNGHKSLLSIATGRGHLAGMRLLIEAGADVNAYGTAHESSLSIATGKGHLAGMKLLIAAGADMNSDDNIYESLIQVATAGGHQEAILLLRVYRADLENDQRSDLPTDSGYESLRHKIQLSEREDDNAGSRLAESTVHWESMTDYSAFDSVGTAERDGLSQKFAKLLFEDVNTLASQDRVYSIQCWNTDYILAGFASRLGQESSSMNLRAVSAFIYKYRRSITMELEQIVTLLPSSAAAMQEQPYDTNRVERSSMYDEAHIHAWLESDTHDASYEQSGETIGDRDPSTYNGVRDEARFVGGPDQGLGVDMLTNELRLADYETSMKATASYQWLVTTLCQSIYLTTAEAKWQQKIRTEVMEALPKPRFSRSAPSTQINAVFHMPWHPATSSESKTANLMSIFTVTGTIGQAQALTCGEYIQQTWKESGMCILQLVNDVSNLPGEQTVLSRTLNGMSLAANLNGSRLVFRVTGPQHSIVETAEILSWLGAAIHSRNSADGVVGCSPVLEHTIASRSFAPKVNADKFIHAQSEVGTEQGHRPFDTDRTADTDERVDVKKEFHFAITFQYETLAVTRSAGSCWLDFFKHCILIQGFPIRRRHQASLGLEIRLDVLASLIHTKHLYELNGHTFLKGYAMLAAPTLCTDDALVWHLWQSSDDQPVSYLDLLQEPHCYKIDIRHVAAYRHIIGWCSTIDHRCGAKDSVTKVERSLLPDAPMTEATHGHALSFGLRTERGPDVNLTPSHATILSPHQTYLDMFRYLEAHFVLLWDTLTSRGWLVDGLKALVHLIRHSIAIDIEEDLGGHLVLRKGDLTESDDPCSYGAARRFLCPRNLAVKISISRINGEKVEHDLLEHRVQQYYHAIERAIISHTRQGTWSKTPRSRLEGWEFVSVARKEEPVTPVCLTLPTQAYNWVDLVRAAGAITLFGEGFGDLLTSRAPGCVARPCNSFCIAATTLDIRKIMIINRCNPRNVPRLISSKPRILWHSPSGSVKPCGCKSIEKADATAPDNVQVVWLEEFANLLPIGNDRLDLEEHKDGAVIFGHHPAMQHYVADLGPPVQGQPPDPSEELDRFTDSAIELNSSHASDEVALASTLASPANQTTMTAPSIESPGHRYANSWQTGGQAVYGNVSGNVSVQHQHFWPSTEVLHSRHPLVLESGRALHSNAPGLLGLAQDESQPSGSNTRSGVKRRRLSDA